MSMVCCVTVMGNFTHLVGYRMPFFLKLGKAV